MLREQLYFYVKDELGVKIVFKELSLCDCWLILYVMLFYAFKKNKVRGIYGTYKGYSRQKSYYSNCTTLERVSLKAAIEFVTSDLPENATRVYTDGSYSQLTHESGWGVYFEKDIHSEESGSVTGVRKSELNSSVTAEYVAIRNALSDIMDLKVGVYELFTDSQEFCEIIWHLYDIWQKHGFMTARRNQVAHKEILQCIHNKIKQIESKGSKIYVIHITAHAGCVGNERADFLARMGRLRIGV